MTPIEVNMKKAMIPAIDLHSDLLSYLTYKPGRSISDFSSRSSYPHLCQGNVKLQTLAISTVTQSKSVEQSQEQVTRFLQLCSAYPIEFTTCQLPLNAQTSLIYLIPAFENASTFARETEPLQDALNRLEEYCRILGPVFYISMTWNGENRFGGGNDTNVGLKEDGKHLLEWMDGKKIALDLSHTSDKLAHDQLDFIDKCSLDIPILASHSNFRPICNQLRNLPDTLSKEIIHRNGLIGLNFFAPFVHHTDYSAIVRHLEYGLSLGGENTLCFGADFFCDSDCPSLLKKYQREQVFYSELENSSVYPSVLELFADKLGTKEELLLKVANQNALNFLKNRIFTPENCVLQLFK